jgi:hypothetical protein
MTPDSYDLMGDSVEELPSPPIEGNPPWTLEEAKKEIGRLERPYDHDPPWYLDGVVLSSFDDGSQCLVSMKVYETQVYVGGDPQLRFTYTDSWYHADGERLLEFDSGEKDQFGWSRYRSAIYRARTWTELRKNLGDIPITEDKDVVPLQVALDGTRSIAKYLLAVHDLETEEIAEIMDIMPDTAQKYV